MAEKRKTDSAWAEILKEHPDIIDTVESGSVYEISADTIRKHREPRLMTKHDTYEMIPQPLRTLGLNVLPVSRSTYAISDFLLHQRFPDVTSLQPTLRALPDFETLTIDSITNENAAINALVISGILNDFLETDGIAKTFNGRMGAGNFAFTVERRQGTPAHLHVCKAQLEIDAGFENNDSVVIIEAKNIRHDDFHIRQLYYPFRKYHTLVNKPIRLVFAQYTNLTYYLYEYIFDDPENYNSIRLLRTKAYTFEDSRITASELWNIYRSTLVRTDDNQDRAKVPFIQADRFDRVISLMERLISEPDGLTTDEVADFLGTVDRQAAYYPAAGEYLGLFDRSERGRIKLTNSAHHIMRLGRRDRQLELAKLMFEHEILRRCFQMAYLGGRIPTVDDVVPIMAELNVCNSGTNDSVFRRRASSVIAWIRWLILLTDDNDS